MALTACAAWFIVAAMLAGEQFALKRTGAYVTWAHYLVAAAWPVMFLVILLVAVPTYIQVLRGKK